MLTVVSSAASGTVDLTAEGTEDWLTTILSPGTTLRAQDVANQPSKLMGGLLLTYFDWANPGGTGFTASGIAKTSTAADSVTGVAASGSTGAGFFHASIIELGWRVRVPATRAMARRLRMWSSQFSCITTVTARLLDGSSVDVAATHNSGANTFAARRWTIDYQSGDERSELVVKFRMTTGLGFTPNVVHFATALGAMP